VAAFYSYIRIFLFLGCALLGIQVPVLVDLYGKALESHLAESRNSLQEFQDDADRYFGGNLERLIAHYKTSGDQIFSAGGDSIQSIYDRNQLLKNHLREFRSSPWAAYLQALVTPLPDVKQEVLSGYAYAIQLKPESILFGLITGLVFTVAVELLLRLILWVPQRLIGNGRRHRRRV
jgi:Protein of unknown function (DUF2937)